MVSITDSAGVAELPDGTGSITVRSLGYRTWDGSVPESGMVIMTPVAVPSGVVVTVSRCRGEFRRSFPSTTLLGRGELNFLGISGMGSVCGLSSGIYAREYGGSMPVLSISVRGGDPAHSEYYVDGHRISSSMDGLPGLYLDPLIFGGMEISRGAGSGFVKGGMTGTVNFLPVSPGEPSRGSLIWGDDGSAALQGSADALDGRFTVSLRRTKGAGGSTGHMGSILAGGRLGQFSWGMLAAAASGETESPDWALPTDGKRDSYSLDTWTRYTDTGGSFSASVGFRGGKHSYISSVPDSIQDDHRELGCDWGVTYMGRLGGMDIELSGEASMDRVSSTALGLRERSVLQAGFRSGYRFDWGTLTAAASANSVPHRKTIWGLSLSMGMPLMDSTLVAHVMGGRSFRRPTLNDLYWPQDSYAEGNPGLAPESSMELEAGVATGSFRQLRLSLTAFTGRSEDLIRWEPGEEGKWSPVNIARVTRRGIESELWMEFSHVDLTGTLTLLQVLDASPGSVNYGSVLPYEPDYTFSLRTRIHWPRWLDWTAMYSGMGIRFKNYSGTSWMPAYQLISGGLDISPIPSSPISLSLWMENITDNQYQETSGFQGRGRTVFLRLSWN